MQLCKQSWSWSSAKIKIDDIPLPRLPIQNASTVLMAIELLQKKLPVSVPDIKRGVANAFAPGRYQIINNQVTTIFDVAHNPQACEYLANKLRHDYSDRKIYAVIGMLADKDITTCCSYFSIEKWYVASLDVPRGASAAVVQQAILANDPQAITATFATPLAAYENVLKMQLKKTL